MTTQLPDGARTWRHLSLTVAANRIDASRVKSPDAVPGYFSYNITLISLVKGE